MSTHTIDLQCRPQQAKDVVFQSMPPDTILLNLQSGYYYSTNPLGAAVWDRCDGERTLAEIAAEIHALYDADAKQIEQDVIAFVRDVAEERLVTLK